MKKQKFDKRILKKNPEELEVYLQFQRRGSVVESKKGKGSYTSFGSAIYKCLQTCR